MTPNYRADIDGLRAVAVLSVLFFHAGIGPFSGGYVGVDIFFVISGYLITTIIVRDIDAGTFSLAHFYERRFRRILPALVAVTGFSLLVGALIFDPRSLEELGKSVVAISLFSSNILFHLQSGYFDGPAELKPLLHTWSLAVEEQYYIFFPLLMLFIAGRSGGVYFRPLLVMALFSLFVSVAMTPVAPSAAFYHIPARAWEFIAGGLLALQVIPLPRQRAVREIMAFIGLLMILASIIFYSRETLFPGLSAALPVLGTVLLIHAGSGKQSWVSRVLAWRPLVFVGLISYSLYLWHWPIIVYAKYYTVTGLDGVQVVAVIALTFILATLSWRYIETPFRRRARRSGSRRALAASGVALTAVLVAGSALLVTGQLSQGGGNHLAAQGTNPGWESWQHCEAFTAGEAGVGEVCGGDEWVAAPRFLLWGDSHARALASGVVRSAAEAGIAGRIATRSACPPLMEIERPGRTVCRRFNDSVLEYLADSQSIDTVILAARWALSMEGERYKKENGKPVRLVDLRQGDTGVSNRMLVERGLRRTVDALLGMGKKVVLVLPVPEVGHDVPSLYHISALTGRDLNRLIAPTVYEYNSRIDSVRELFDRIRQEYSIELVDPGRYLCDGDICRVVEGDKLLYRDDDHLSTFGSRYLAHSYDPIFRQILSEGRRAGVTLNN